MINDLQCAGHERVHCRRERLYPWTWISSEKTGRVLRSMSGVCFYPSAEVEVLTVQRRHRFSAAEKQRMVEETYKPGMTLLQVARDHDVSPSLLLRWALKAFGADRAVVPVSEVHSLRHQVNELQRLLGKKTLENEILKEEVARANK